MPWQQIAQGGLATVSTLVQRSAINDAEAKQREGVQNALDLQKQVYNRTKQNLAPYVSIGQAAAQRMNAGMGYPQPAPAPAEPATPTPRTVSRSPSTWDYIALAGTVPPPSLIGHTFGMDSNGQAPSRTAPANLMAGYAGAAGTGGVVQMRAPTGEVMAVPTTLRAHYEQLGAKAV